MNCGLCKKELLAPVVSLNLVNFFEEPFHFCSINHAIYFLAFPEKHWPMDDSIESLDTGIV